MIKPPPQPLRLTDVIETIHQTHPDHRLLLIADQFEELYTLCKKPKTRHAFHPQQSKIQNLKSKIVLTLRADFLGQASLYAPFAQTLNRDGVAYRAGWTN